MSSKDWIELVRQKLSNYEPHKKKDVDVTVGVSSQA